LADINPRKAKELATGHVPQLEDLLKAADEIARRAAELGWDRDGSTGLLENDQVMYFRKYKQGSIYWTKGLAHEVTRAFMPFYIAFPFGYPRSGEVNLSPSRFGTKAIGQFFDNGMIISSEHGMFGVSGAIYLKYSYGPEDTVDFLGCPVAAAKALDRVEWQRFEGGFLCSSEAGTFTVRSEVAERADGWMPVLEEEEAGSCRVQRFKNTAGAEMAVYSSDDAGAIRVTGRKLAFYEEIGGPDSWLGLPTAMARELSRNSYVQKFEHGSMYSRSGHDLVAVPAETVELVGERLGWPVADKKSIGGSGNETIQFFEAGAVILRDGKYEAWVPQESPEPPPAR
jgi:uncharacterized protein with LGFP repeats